MTEMSISLETYVLNSLNSSRVNEELCENTNFTNWLICSQSSTLQFASTAEQSSTIEEPSVFWYCSPLSLALIFMCNFIKLCLLYFLVWRKGMQLRSIRTSSALILPLLSKSNLRTVTKKFYLHAKRQLNFFIIRALVNTEHNINKLKLS